jgi:hypothetical protein
MATSTTNAYCDGSNLTNFNAWANWMYLNFIAFGWVQTADTGQGTFPASGSVPTTAGTYYAIFKSNDATTGACPIYVKIEFWAQSNVPYFGITVGTGGTDGAGNLFQPASQHIYGGGTYSLKASAASTTNLLPCYASGDAGSIRFAMWCSTTSQSPDYSNAVGFVVARSRDSNGLVTGSYVQLWTWCSNSYNFQTIFASSLGTTNSIDASGCFIAPYPFGMTNSWLNNGAIMVSPVMQNIGGLSNPTPDLLISGSSNFPAGTTATVTVYGVTHTYLSGTSWYGTASPSSGVVAFLSSTYSTPLIRYE